MKDLTIIIPTMNSSGDPKRDEDINRAFRECVLSLQETTTDIPIIVASNGGDAKALPIESSKRIKRINIYDQGQCKAVNAAVAMTDTEWILVTNDDMIYSPGWLDRLTKGIGSVNKCVSPNLVEPQDGAPPFIKYFCGGAGGDFNKAKWLMFAKEHMENKWEEGFNLPFLMRRSLWEKVGGYDIKYDPWGSNGDSDLQAKIYLAGEQTMRNRNSIVYHFSQTSGTFHPSKQGFWNQNWAYFVQKWGFERQSGDKVWYSQGLIKYKMLTYKPDWAASEKKPPQESLP